MNHQPSICASVVKTARAIQAGEVSSESVVRAYLEPIESVNPLLNAVMQTTGEEALQEAREADAALPRGQIRGWVRRLDVIPLREMADDVLYRASRKR